MSQSAAATIPAVPVEPSKRRRIIKIVSWILALVALLVDPQSRGRRRLGLADRALGHRHRDLARLRRPRLHLPGPPDDADRARLVRDPPLRLSGRRDVHGRARVVRGRRRAQQLPSGEHRDVRDAAHVRRDRPGCDVPGDPRRATSSRRSSTSSSARSSTSTSSARSRARSTSSSGTSATRSRTIR